MFTIVLTLDATTYICLISIGKIDFSWILNVWAPAQTWNFHFMSTLTFEWIASWHFGCRRYQTWHNEPWGACFAFESYGKFLSFHHTKLEHGFWGLGIYRMSHMDHFYGPFQLFILLQICSRAQPEVYGRHVWKRERRGSESYLWRIRTSAVLAVWWMWGRGRCGLLRCLDEREPNYLSKSLTPCLSGIIY